jgi:nucleoside-diphosphate-sugar epimerase
MAMRACGAIPLIVPKTGAMHKPNKFAALKGRDFSGNILLAPKPQTVPAKKGVFMKALFIGGTGNISTACSWLALDKGIDLYIFTRGRNPVPFSEDAKVLSGDIRDKARSAQILKHHEFDVIVDWVAFTPEHIDADIELFQGRTRQYIFISSAATYQRFHGQAPITEDTPRSNSVWQYARDKIACEERLIHAHLAGGFPVTIVRPSLTYCDSWVPAAVGGHDYTIIDRMKRGKKIIVHGDGRSLWILTHSGDFAKGLIGILGRQESIGESYHITSDEVLTWDQIYTAMGQAAGVQPDLIHIPSVFINRFDARTGAGLLGEKDFSTVFDNSKIKLAVPAFRATITFAEGMRRCMDWFETHEDLKAVDKDRNEMMDRIIEAYQCMQA